MARKAPSKSKVITAEQAKSFKRMDAAAEMYGVTVAYFKQLINQGRLTRFKVGKPGRNSITFIDVKEFERLILADVGNHGAKFAPQAEGGQ